MRIAVRDQVGRDAEAGAAFRLSCLKPGRNLRRDLAQVHGFALQFEAGHAREIEQVVDKLGHPAAGGLHAVQVVQRFLVEQVAVIFQQGLAKALDAAQRGAQVVRDGIRERFQLAVGGGQLLGALQDAPFQSLVELGDLGFDQAAVRDFFLGGVE